MRLLKKENGSVEWLACLRLAFNSGLVPSWFVGGMCCVMHLGTCAILNPGAPQQATVDFHHVGI